MLGVNTFCKRKRTWTHPKEKAVSLLIWIGHIWTGIKKNTTLHYTIIWLNLPFAEKCGVRKQQEQSNYLHGICAGVVEECCVKAELAEECAA